MSPIALTLCVLWIAVALVAAAVGARRGLREGRGPRAWARLTSPTVYLFTAYLIVAGWATPRSPGESTSPLFGLALVLPAAYALATLSAIGRAERPRLAAIGLGVLHGGAVLAAAALVLAAASPEFTPGWLRR